MNHRKDIIASRIHKRGYQVSPSGCWEILGATNNSGYVNLSISGKVTPAHRLAYEAWVGDIPQGHVVRHKCDVRRCVNPEHLEVGTYQDNSNDTVSRGRTLRGDAHPSTKISDSQVVWLKSEYATGKFTQAELANTLGVTRAAVTYKLGRPSKKKLSEQDVMSIREKKDDYSRAELARQYGVAACTISQIVNNKAR